MGKPTPPHRNVARCKQHFNIFSHLFSRQQKKISIQAIISHVISYFGFGDSMMTSITMEEDG